MHTFAEAGEIIMGGFGRELFAAAQVIFLGTLSPFPLFSPGALADATVVFIMGSHILTFSIMLNVTTGHGACTIVFTIVGLLVSLVCTVPRTMRMVSYFSIVSFVSILGAVFITMIGVGVEGRTPPLEVSARPGTPFWLAFGAVGNIIFAYGGFPSLLRFFFF